MNLPDLLGSSITAAITAAIYIGLLSIRDFGKAAFYFAIIAFLVALMLSMICAFPVSLIKKRFPFIPSILLVSVIGFLVGSLVFLVLTRWSFGGANGIKMMLIYSVCGMVSAILALAYLDRAGLTFLIRKLLRNLGHG